MSARPRILVLTSYYLPGYLSGGPLRSIANLVDRLGDAFEWWILTSDHDLGVPTPYPDVVSDRWNVVGNSRIFHASAATRTPAGILRVIRETPHDVLYLNSFFDPRFAILPAVARALGRFPDKPLLIAPRGEFSDGAVDIKAWKKCPYLVASRLTGVYRRAHWHASTRLEVEDIRRELKVGPERIHAASDLATLATRATTPSRAPAKIGDAFRICFLSRISRKKNLDYALRVLAKMNRRIDFDVYGPREDAEYWAECEAIIATMPANVRVRYQGAVPAERVGEVFAQYDLFFMPTRGENFGHVFVEAWSSGTPVLISDQTPWRDLVHEGVGWDLPLDAPDAYVRALEEAIDRDPEARDERVARCRAFAERHIRDDAAVEANRRMFLKVAGVAA